jgi:hypothetical protein
MVLRSLLISALVATGCAVTAAACSSFSSDSSGDRGDAATSPDGDAGAPPASDSGVFCGVGPSCNPQSQVCCDHLDGGGVGCIPQAERANCQGAARGCDDGADCASMPDGVCCGVLGSNRIDVLQSSCSSLSHCKTTEFFVVVCDPSAPNASTACPGGVACNVPNGGGFGFCQGLVHP